VLTRTKGVTDYPIAVTVPCRIPWWGPIWPVWNHLESTPLLILMTRNKHPQSTMSPGAPNYANARGRAAAEDNEGIVEDDNPAVSPGSVPESVENPRSLATDEVAEFQDQNYAQYMNRGDGRYVKLMENHTEGSFGPDKDHGGETGRIHRLKNDKSP
jgi:hypothetical protein